MMTLPGFGRLALFLLLCLPAIAAANPVSPLLEADAVSVPDLHAATLAALDAPAPANSPVLSAPLAALDATPATSGFLGSELFKTLVTVAALFALEVYRRSRKDKADRDIELFEKGVGIAYNVVSEVAILTPTQVDDKVALGLKVLRDFLANHRVELTPERATEAKLRFQALHGEEKVAAKHLAEAALVKTTAEGGIAAGLAQLGKAS